MRHALRLALPLLLVLPAGAAAQSVAVSAGGAAFLPLRDLGKATGSLRAPGGQPLQVRSGIGAAPLLTARVEVGSPWPGVTLHGSFSATLGATAEGEVALCDLLRDEGLDVEDLCEPRSVDADVQIFGAGVTFARPAATGGIRPYLSLEAGAIRYAFEPAACQDEVCRLHDNVLEDRADPMVHFALGLVTEAGPVALRAEVGDVVSAYKGGGEGTRGETQNNLVLRALVAVPLG